MATVIIFGPTGNVASVAARTAQERGAKVHLAMRDPSKTIPGLTAESEKAGGFVRVKADLNQPDTVAAAVKGSGATRAFIYHAPGGKDHMKATCAALKESGVELVVFLSSYSVYGNPKDFPPSDLIPFVHAQVELSLDAVYGVDNYVAIRPGNFVTNLMRYKDGVVNGDVRIYGGDFTFDCITPEDMGQVAGTILAEGGAKNGQKKVYLYGPEIYTQIDGLKTIGEVLGKEVKVTTVDEQEGRQQYEAAGIPKPFIDYMLSIFGNPDSDMGSKRTNYDEGVKNVELYAGRPAMGLKDWVNSNRQLFSA